MNLPPGIDEDDAWDLDLKPEDIFSVNEKLVMLEHMKKREWAQLGFIITKKVVQDWEEVEREDFLKYFHQLPGKLHEQREADYGQTYYRALFVWSDSVYHATKELAESLRESGREESARKD